MPRERKLPAKLRDSATVEDLEAAEEGSTSAPESPMKLQRKESSSSSSDLASPGEKMNFNNTIGSNVPITNMTHLTSAVNQGIYPAQMGPGNGTVQTEPMYPCGICLKEVDDNDDAILCETGCGKWYHRLCTGLTAAAYGLLTSEGNAEWVCNRCIETKNIPLVKLNS
ncbi:uncharacterized protein LOC116299424 [Actinia tenebrosa]|uniref:Uncharacterized protein LOC116299424 n=1 Tax=Actinia tenebrosa TaxID=6105 RepID=A0A6P8I5U3_ACTTE|nr:uncharacterized protein LOC116299424 [Actinia tenebrosa]